MKKAKKILMGVLIFLGVVLATAVIYVLYVFFSYKRIEDNHIEQPVNVEGVAKQVETGVEYSAISYNVGFGAYLPSFSFFMDGGKQSWADSRESVEKDINAIGNYLAELDPDFLILQEVDYDSTRAYHVDQAAILTEKLGKRDCLKVVNFDSAFLMYPILQPHGKSVSGIMTYSKYQITSGLRRSFPISNSFSKLVDLDRCLSISRIPVENGKEFIVINLHMSAYGNSEAVRSGQTNLIKEVLADEYAKGNYVICGGDFNHDLKLKNPNDEGIASWAHPYDRADLPAGFKFAIDDKTDEELAAMNNSNRDAGEPYDPATTLTITLDGFIVSDNVTVTYYDNLSTGFKYSDHEPVVMKFVLED